MSFFKSVIPKVSEKSSPSPENEMATDGPDGSSRYTVEEGINNAKLTYQDAGGAPIESKSPLGYSVGWLSVLFLNMNMMIGTGVFSTRMSYLGDIQFIHEFIFLA